MPDLQEEVIEHARRAVENLQSSLKGGSDEVNETLKLRQEHQKKSLLIWRYILHAVTVCPDKKIDRWMRKPP